uniref:Uncharacterized protein n=1 Tax=Meloidogyne enterolobii TaxID=390850 RepID=A0A6V7U319_MELEN|nr:unnamed protein product [Meloidogyne enterolobii]
MLFLFDFCPWNDSILKEFFVKKYKRGDVFRVKINLGKLKNKYIFLFKNIFVYFLFLGQNMFFNIFMYLPRLFKNTFIL